MEPRFSLSRVKELWSEPTHLKNRFIGAASIGSLSGEFLYPYLSFKNAHAEYIFPFKVKIMNYVWPLSLIFLGLANLLS